MKVRSTPYLSGLLLLCSLCIRVGVAQAGFGEAPLVFLHVTVINPGTSSVEPDRAVTISGSHITAVSNSGNFQPPSHARVIDGTGQFLIPGLWDMHVHVAFGDWFPGGRDIILPLLVANGVTGIRDMGGDIPVLFAWRKQIASGELIGPRMVVAGPMLDGYLPDGKTFRFPSSIPVTTVEDAVAAVDSLKAQQVDFIKVQSLIPHDAYLAAATEAHKQGLPFVGHVPDAVRIDEAAAVGQKSIEHMMGSSAGCSTVEDRVIKGEVDTQLLLNSFDQQKCNKMMALLAQRQVWQVPTMVWERGGTFLDQLDWKHQPLDRYVPAHWRDVTWRRFEEQMMPGLQKDPLALRQRSFAQELAMAGAMHRAGVPFLAGTDSAPGIYIIPGFSLHDELANFVEAGFTPMEALQTATSNPALFLGKSDIGAVKPGGLADLVLLSANPLNDIQNTKKINAVVINGRFLDRAALDRMLAQVEVSAKAQK
jgi:imidazolonepropionase-like amidohydrolase